MTQRRGARYVVGGGAAACAVCCAPPILALIGIAGGETLATAATFAFAGLEFAIVVAVASVAAFMLRRRHRDRLLARPRTCSRWSPASLIPFDTATLTWEARPRVHRMSITCCLSVAR